MGKDAAAVTVRDEGHISLPVHQCHADDHRFHPASYLLPEVQLQTFILYPFLEGNAIHCTLSEAGPRASARTPLL